MSQKVHNGKKFGNLSLPLGFIALDLYLLFLKGVSNPLQVTLIWVSLIIFVLIAVTPIRKPGRQS
ncbi:hypothetical protein [Schleiferilactobacillus harbinensis]|jgi:hypothetical protein|uniref:Uncharacterized protein n=1 Tax=Schleiferilactobacillus harbinensis TaxID=304207 RepID=A0A5P2U1A4_9LACO|nr:hypothetical protein [Schleiferilactobacillus harbinensis]MCT2907340.1 hypothetical protein [Schleiferilactobacillus harbinensis]QEU48668.1 hypothetical protein FMM01_15840 [Schleiferilactobacillus harbinensis]QFR22570.1 hypothetical protein D1010_03440 [Schleiferilactobacillus harbinensis]